VIAAAGAMAPPVGRRIFGEGVRRPCSHRIRHDRVDPHSGATIARALSASAAASRARRKFSVTSTP
jgi:hypothetical protein